MAKALKSQQEIEALLLSELRQAEGCEGATAVLIYPLANERGDATWSVPAVDPGTSGVDRCLNVLAEIEAKLQTIVRSGAGRANVSDAAADYRAWKASVTAGWTASTAFRPASSRSTFGRGCTSGA